MRQVPTVVTGFMLRCTKLTSFHFDVRLIWCRRHTS